ncbi:hypothetical protein RFZ55_00790, partial [Acinetobacter baumannii]|nr:hypothetical protein [Acinetobacter baumannii]
IKQTYDCIDGKVDFIESIKNEPSQQIQGKLYEIYRFLYSGLNDDDDDVLKEKSEFIKDEMKKITKKDFVSFEDTDESIVLTNLSN